jgi:hypothetical protein
MHTYREIMGPSGIDRIVQRHDKIGKRRVMPSQPDYLVAKAEYGQPRITQVPYVPPKPKPDPAPKELAERKLRETDSKVPRPLEDLYDILMTKGIITVEDIPVQVSEVIASRKAARMTLRQLKEEA